jgi:hypothetical protein
MRNPPFSQNQKQYVINNIENEMDYFPVEYSKLADMIRSKEYEFYTKFRNHFQEETLDLDEGKTPMCHDDDSYGWHCVSRKDGCTNAFVQDGLVLFAKKKK